MVKLKDLTGLVFGKATVIERTENDKYGRAKWKCVCDCGAEFLTSSTNLMQGQTTSCGCVKKTVGGRNRSMLEGAVFGRLTVIKQDGVRNSQTSWLCRCQCGKTVIAVASKLKNKETQSCGCLKSEMSAKRMTTHGHSKSRIRSQEYNTWRAMKQRCCNPNYFDYENYGGRGITICDRWNESFEAFIFDMGDKPTPSHSIDRIDVNGNYEPKNCRWATPSEQARNKRKH